MQPNKLTRLAILSLIALLRSAQGETFAPLKYEIVLDKPFCHDDGNFIWFHPRVSPFPGADGAPNVLMTFQKHLHQSDYYSGLSYIATTNLGKTWSERKEPRVLAWREEAGGRIVVGVCDVTPGWHEPAGKVIAIGVKVRYLDGIQQEDTPGWHEAAYAVYDPEQDSWTDWRMIEMPDREGKFYSVAPGCTQWVVEADGTILLPIYFRGADHGLAVVTVLRCSFDGETLAYLEHGDEIPIDVARGAHEPSIAKFKGKYYLTIRNDEKGYVTSGADGLHYDPIIPWTFNDGEELGSYNTQQHWLTHSDGLFLVYTRRGADNDHIMRNRAPLFIAQVDPDRLRVLRETERVLIPERGAQMGNFGATAINAKESWVTVAEGMWGEARERGAEGCVFVARVIWDRPNKAIEP